MFRASCDQEFDNSRHLLVILMQIIFTVLDIFSSSFVVTASKSYAGQKFQKFPLRDASLNCFTKLAYVSLIKTLPSDVML